MLMGFIQKQNIRDYWSTDEILSTPMYPRVMSANKYRLINSFLHFNDNVNQPKKGTPEYDPLYKV